MEIVNCKCQKNDDNFPDPLKGDPPLKIFTGLNELTYKAG